MNRFHRYMFANVGLASLMAVGMFAFLLIVGNVLRDVAGMAADGRLDIGMFFRLLMLLVPYVVAYALPMGMLTGVLLVLGRMSAQREITAMRSAGASLLQIASPVFFLAVVGVVFAIAVNFYYAPQARAQYRFELSQAIRYNPLNFVVEDSFIRNFPGYVLYVGEKDEEELREIWLWETDDRRRVVRMIRAESGTLEFDADTESLLLSMREASFEFRNPRDPEDLRSYRPPLEFEATSIRLPLDQILGRQTTRRNLSRMTFAQVMDERARLKTEWRETGDDRAFAYMIRAQVSLQERFAMSFSILSLTLLAVPLGVTIQRKETMANLAVALLLSLFFYFLVIVAGWFERKPEWRPDLLVWIPNILFQALGVWLFYRSERR